MSRIVSASVVTVLIAMGTACGGSTAPAVSPSRTSCQLALSPSSQTVAASGGDFFTAVAGPCPWATTSDSSWIVVNYGEGVGTGSVTYSVRENTTHVTRE